MQIEQTGQNSIKIVLESDLEKATLGKSDTLEITLVQSASLGYRGTVNGSSSVTVKRDG